MDNKPPALWDLETGFNVATIFQLWNKHGPIPFDNILSESYIICGSIKHLGQDDMVTVSIADNERKFKKNSTDDYRVVKELHERLSQEDTLIGHNGDAFDLRFFNTRCIFHGLTPLPQMRTIDTLKVARKHFKFNSNRLDYLGKFLLNHGKMETSRGLWHKALQGDVVAVREMEEYNRKDVLLLEEVYLKLRPFMHNHPSLSSGSSCPKCTSTNIIKQGIRRRASRFYQTYQCKGCGGWFSDTKSVGTAND